MTLTLDQYFIGRAHSAEQSNAAIELLGCVNVMLYAYQADTGNELPINIHTNSCIAGLTEGGFRLPECPQGAANSAHKHACAVDIYDPKDDLDTWLTDHILERYGLYRESPIETHGWCHLTTRAPGSGRRTFLP